MRPPLTRLLRPQLSQGGVDTPRMDAAKAAGQSVERIAGNFLTCKGCAEDVDSNVAMIKEIFLVQSGEGARAHLLFCPPRRGWGRSPLPTRGGADDGVVWVLCRLDGDPGRNDGWER